MEQKKYTCYFLNEFYFKEEALYASSSIFFSYYNPSRISVPAKQAVEVFSRYFSLITFAGEGVLYQEPLNKYVD